MSAMEVIEPMEFTYDIPQSDNMKKVQELMVTGFSGNLNFERDLMGRYSPFSSITRFYNDPVVILTISALILIGGIGFFVWNDLREHGLHCRHYALQTKMDCNAPLNRILHYKKLK